MGSNVSPIRHDFPPRPVPLTHNGLRPQDSALRGETVGARGLGVAGTPMLRGGTDVARVWLAGTPTRIAGTANQLACNVVRWTGTESRPATSGLK
jgi:hypothetical protein